MSTLLDTVNNGIGVFGPIPVNLITDTDVVIGIPANAEVELDAQNVTVRAVSVLGTLSVPPVVVVDNGTTANDVTSSTSLNFTESGHATPLVIPANHFMVSGDPDTVYFRFHISTNAVGQATSARQRLDNISTITTAAPHGFSAGDEVELRSMTDTSYNGRFVIVSIPSSTQFTIFNPGVDEGTVADAAGRVGAFDALVTINALQLN